MRPLFYNIIFEQSCFVTIQTQLQNPSGYWRKYAYVTRNLNLNSFRPAIVSLPGQSIAQRSVNGTMGIATSIAAWTVLTKPIARKLGEKAFCGIRARRSSHWLRGRRRQDS